MNKNEIKAKLHTLVDSISDDMLLFNFYDAFTSLVNESGVSNELTPEQNNRLAESLAQYKSGSVISDMEVRRQISLWIEK